jgi:hypothetical protein
MGSYACSYQISTVASYVPLWLKFTYLSDILVSFLPAFHVSPARAPRIIGLIQRVK